VSIDDASTRDWLSSPRTSLIAWWVPHAAIVASLLASVPVRAAIWIVALVWMGAAAHTAATPDLSICHDCAGVSACRHKLRRISGLAFPRCFHSRGRQIYLVGHGARLGKILIVKCTIRSGCGTKRNWRDVCCKSVMRNERTSLCCDPRAQSDPYRTFAGFTTPYRAHWQLSLRARPRLPACRLLRPSRNHDRPAPWCL
jgi:hypothetical protein